MGKKKNKPPSLYHQALQVLHPMLSVGEKKHGAEDITGKIFSYTTYNTYKTSIEHFCDWCKINHPRDTSFKHCRKHITKYLSECVERNLSASTVQTYSKALNKIYSITPADSDYFTPPIRHREDFTRSRTHTTSDAHFSTEKNSDLILLCRSIGCRREGLTRIRKRDLLTFDELVLKYDYLKKQSSETLTDDDRVLMMAYTDALLFKDRFHYIVHLKEKGGRHRLAPIVATPENEKRVVDMFDKLITDDAQVFPKPHRHADIHSYRSDYANNLYKMLERPLNDLQHSEKIFCRGDQKGQVYDKQAVLLVEKALGHNTSHTFIRHYTR